jgi:very-short-patch-repair endonuclease
MKEAGIHPPRHYGWLDTDPDYARRFAEVQERTRAAGILVRKPHPSGYRVQGSRAERRKANQEKVLTALATCGIIQQAAREAGISAATYYQWCRDEDWFRERAEQVLADTEDMRREIVARRVGNASRARWDDPGRREAWSEWQREHWTPERRAAASERMTARTANPESRAALGEASRARWAQPGAREKERERMKSQWADPDYRERVAGLSRTLEARERSREAATQQWAAMDPDTRSERVRHMHRAFKGGYKLTSIEAAVMSALNDREVPYLAHKPIGDYVADICVPSLRLVIECDGAYHHDQRKDGDAERDAALAALGYRTLRLAEKEIKARDWGRLDEMLGQLSDGTS